MRFYGVVKARRCAGVKGGATPSGRSSSRRLRHLSLQLVQPVENDVDLRRRFGQLFRHDFSPPPLGGSLLSTDQAGDAGASTAVSWSREPQDENGFWFFLWCLFFSVSFQTSASMQEATPAQFHIWHVSKSINGTPGNVGLLTALEEEAGIAAQHAALAIGDLTNLESIQRHVRHVRHAVDPSTESGGPGKGYGLLRAAKGVATHIKLAANSDGSSENIELHATPREHERRECRRVERSHSHRE